METTTSTSVTDTTDSSSYEQTLCAELAEKREVVLDFTCLKACLDPQREMSPDAAEFNYKDFLYEKLCKGTIFPKLEVLKVRNLVIPNSLSNEDEDHYAELIHGIMQLSSLEELDLSGNRIPEDLQKHITFWNMPRLKKLYLENMELTSLPPSVGRLRHLEILSAKENKLTSLPITLTFCESLRELNLQQNSLRTLPSTVIHLPQLRDLRRLNNPLPQLFNGFEGAPHITISSTPNTSKQENVLFNPDSLQGLCAKASFTHKIDYWSTENLGQLQSRIMDCLASNFKLCEHCNRAIPPSKEMTVDVMLLRYLDLRLVPVQFTTCSSECQASVLQHYRELQTQTQKDIDEEYEKNVREAEALANDSNDSDGKYPKPWHNKLTHNTRNKRLMCTIM